MIFFDIDNTLIDHNQTEKRAIIATFNYFGLKIDKNILHIWSEISEEYYDKYIQGLYSFEEQGIKRVEDLWERLGILNTNNYNNFFNYYLQKYEENWFLYEDVLPVLKKISEKNRLGIISNGDKEQQKKKLVSTKIMHFFEEVIISSEIGFSKPNEIIFEKACEIAKLNIRECIYVGDNFQVDILASNRAGFKAIYLNRLNKNINVSDPKIKVIQNLYELIQD